MTTIKEVLKGAKAGTMQSVGYMQMIPLLSDIQDDRFTTPDKLYVSTSGYGSLNVRSDEDKPTILPSSVAYMTKERSQDHMLPSAKIITKGKRCYNMAACIESSQGGYMTEGQHKLSIAPYPMREGTFTKSALNDKNYGRFWKSIEKLNRTMGSGTEGHLIYFFNKFKKQLDEFVAEFEPVPNQVGAIFLIDGNVVGIEKTPSTKFWNSMWRPIVRDCYGALAMMYAKEVGASPMSRFPLDTKNINTIADLRLRLDKVNKKEERFVKDKIKNLITKPLAIITTESAALSMDIMTVNNDQFVGQIIKDGEKVVYTSFITKQKWNDNIDWHEADDFKL